MNSTSDAARSIFITGLKNAHALEAQATQCVTAAFLLFGAGLAAPKLARKAGLARISFLRGLSSNNTGANQ